MEHIVYIELILSSGTYKNEIFLIPATTTGVFNRRASLWFSLYHRQNPTYSIPKGISFGHNYATTKVANFLATIFFLKPFSSLKPEK